MFSNHLIFGNVWSPSLSPKIKLIILGTSLIKSTVGVKLSLLSVSCLDSCCKYLLSCHLYSLCLLLNKLLFIYKYSPDSLNSTPFTYLHFESLLDSITVFSDSILDYRNTHHIPEWTLSASFLLHSSPWSALRWDFYHSSPLYTTPIAVSAAAVWSANEPDETVHHSHQPGTVIYLTGRTMVDPMNHRILTVPATAIRSAASVQPAATADVQSPDWTVPGNQSISTVLYRSLYRALKARTTPTLRPATWTDNTIRTVRDQRSIQGKEGACLE